MTFLFCLYEDLFTVCMTFLNYLYDDLLLSACPSSTVCMTFLFRLYDIPLLSEDLVPVYVLPLLSVWGSQTQDIPHHPHIERVKPTTLTETG